jgi:hypothetical protein
MSTRNELEYNVMAVNKVLKEKVPTMTILELLRNCHPSIRAEYANKFYKEKLLTENELHEFVKFSGK